MRCEYLNNPLGIDAQKPRLSWKIEDSGQMPVVRGQKQTAYQVLVASTPDLFAKSQGDLWDSGKEMSNAISHIEYCGKPLQSRQQCFWKVKTWLTDAGAGCESKPASWEMGLIKSDDWKARWIEGTGYAEQKSTTPVASLTILGAVYGSKETETNATAILAGLVKNNSLL